MAESEACGNCGISPEKGAPFNHCSRCKDVPYCSKACQVHHWKNGHKQTCEAASEQEEDTVTKQNKTVGAAVEEPSTTKKKERPKPSSPGAAAAEEHAQKPKPPRKVTARLDAKGASLSFGRDDNCAICLDTLRTPIRLDCGHWHCKECIESLRQSASAPDSCPVCREPLPPGAEKLYDEAKQEFQRLKRQMERRGWSNLPRKLQREWNKVIELMKQAAAQEHTTSQYDFGCAYRDGKGVPQCWRTAMKWWEQAAAQGHAAAQFNLGTMYHLGEGAAPVNFTAAREWYGKAAAQGDEQAQHNLGLMHYEGKGEPQDFIQARYWWEQAAAQGNANAIINIGVLYLNGAGVEQDLNEAVRWYLKAKAHGEDVSVEIAQVMQARKTQQVLQRENEKK